MWNVACPLHQPLQGAALVDGDGDLRHRPERGVKGAEVRQVEPAMQGGHRAMSRAGKQRQVQQVEVEVQDVERRSLPADPIQHHQVMRQRILHAGIEAQRDVGAGDQARGRFRIRSGEQRDIVSKLNQFVREVSDDALGAAVAAGRHAFDQRGNLSDAHLRTLGP